GLLPRRRDGRGPCRLRRRPRARPARAREPAHEAMGTVSGTGTEGESGLLPADGVRSMFDRIAPVYDAMNRVMTAGLDRRWRRSPIEQTGRSGARVLDGCCGTGDLAIAARAHGAVAVGLDFSEPMLECAR